MSKMKFVLCVIALAVTSYAQAQEKARTTQDQPGKSQAGKTESDRAKSAENQTNQTREERNRAQSDVTVRTDRSSTSDKPLDSILASCLLVGNQNEVAISQFAAERAKHDKVKEFARQMVKDHTQAISMLQRFAGPDASKDLGSSFDASRGNRSETVNRSTTSTDANRSPQENEQRNSNRNPAAPDAVRNPAAPDAVRNPANRDATSPADRTRSETAVQIRSEHEAMPDKLLAIEREVAQKCLTMSKQELEQSSNFDQAYVGMQIGAHIGMIAKLETFKQYASQDLGKVIQESLETTQSHLRHAKELVTEISHDSGNRSNANPRSETNVRNPNSRDDNARNPANREGAKTRRESTETKTESPKN